MAKITLHVEELMSWIAGGDPEKVKEVRQMVAAAMLDSWSCDPIFREAIEKKAEELAHTKVERMIRDAFDVQTTGWGAKSQKTFVGWAVAIIKEETNRALRGEGNSEVSLESLFYHVSEQFFKDWKYSYTKAFDNIQPMVDEAVRDALPKYVTEEYRARVAEHFEKHKLETFATEIVQKVIGAMLMNGTFRIDGGKIDGTHHTTL